MADATAHSFQKTSPRAGRQSFPIADGVTVYVGSLVGEESGYLNHWAAGATDTFLGLLIGGDDRAGDGILIGETSDSPDPEGHVDTSGVTLMHLSGVGGTPTQAKVGDLIYAPSSNVADLDLATTGSTTHPIGYMSRFRSATDVDVTLYTPTEMQAQRTA